MDKMDNIDQIKEIITYREYLQSSFGITLDEETAAKLWILKFAAIWRAIQMGKVSPRKQSTGRLNYFGESDDQIRNNALRNSHGGLHFNAGLQNDEEQV